MYNRNPIPDAYQLIQDCEKLRSLTWYYAGYPNTPESAPPLIQDFQAGSWPFLESLDLTITTWGTLSMAEQFFHRR